jgi:hypothetical protein
MLLEWSLATPLDLPFLGSRHEHQIGTLPPLYVSPSGELGRPFMSPAEVKGDLCSFAPQSRGKRSF